MAELGKRSPQAWQSHKAFVSPRNTNRKNQQNSLHTSRSAFLGCDPFVPKNLFVQSCDRPLFSKKSFHNFRQFDWFAPESIG